MPQNLLEHPCPFSELCYIVLPKFVDWSQLLYIDLNNSTGLWLIGGQKMYLGMLIKIFTPYNVVLNLCIICEI